MVRAKSRFASRTRASQKLSGLVKSSGQCFKNAFGSTAKETFHIILTLKYLEYLDGYLEYLE